MGNVLHQLASAASMLAGAVSAYLWWRSAAVKIPGQNTDPAPSSGDMMRLFPVLREAAALNSRAALFTAVSVLFNIMSQVV